jgi:23S rRNA pseudouridine1911/1915/1917 synthase
MSLAKLQTFHVTSQHAAHALQAALRAWLPDASWSRIKRLIADRHVQINGNVCVDATRSLQLGEVVRVSAHPLVPAVRAEDVQLVHVDPHVVVVDKPAGVTTLRHAQEREWSAQRKNREPTLEEWVAKLLQQQEPRPARERSKSSMSVRAVHRLDRDTSGLMVFARSPAAEVALIRQFKVHSVERAYVAIALGNVAASTITSYLVRDRGDGLRGSTADPEQPGAERAVTHVEPLEQLADHTVVQCRLETGRTHQIRIHLAEQGHMLCGEKMYNRSRDGSVVHDSSGAPRQMLHAAALGFVHPESHESVRFLSPLPRDMQRVLRQLRRAEA